MKWLKWLTGDTGTAKKVVDSVVATGDALFYTDEEKASDYKSYREWYLKYLEATQPQNVSRRIIAVIVVAIWALLIVVGVTAQGFGNETFATYIFNTLSENVNPILMVIVGFYFLKHIVSANKK